MSESTWDDPRITAYVLGDMSADDQAVFESELESNSTLAAAVEEARGVTGQLQALYASESTPPLDSERRSAIVNGEVTKVLSPSQSSASWRVPALVLAAAAVLLLLVGLAPWLRQQDTTVAQDNQDSRLEQLGQKIPGVDELRLSNSVKPSAMQPQSEQPSKELMKSDVVSDVEARASNLESSTFNRQLATKQSAVERAASEPFASRLAMPAEEQPVPQSQGARGRAASQNRLKDGKLEIGSSAANAPKVASGVQTLDGTTEDFQRQLQTRSDQPSRPMSPRNASAQANGQAASAPTGAADASGGMNRKSGEADKRRELQLSSGRRAVDSPPPAKPPASDSLRMQTKRLRQEVETMKAQVEVMPAPVERELQELELNQIEEQIGLQKHPGGGLGGGGLGGRGVGIRKKQQPSLRPELDDLPELGFGLADPDGQGPGTSGDQFDRITDNPFKRVDESMYSTFSVDVDTASYSKTRDFLMRAGRLPSPDAVRIEELINYFDYDYKAPGPDAEHPFATHVEVTTCPWNTKHKLARIGLKGKTMTTGERPPCNLVFLLDVSGSMNKPNKLPLVVEGMSMLIDQLKKKDRVAIVVYAGSEGLVLDSTSAKNKQDIKAALTRLKAGGSTNGGTGIALAYQTARDNFITDGVNRVILCTDGDFNVGITNTADLVRMVEKESKGGIFISVLGFGMGNHNDARLEQISGRGNGNYAFIDTKNEARKVLVDQTNGTLVTIAKDVKIQIEFNGTFVSQYRLIGYVNRILAKEDFKDDTKDAGEIGAGHAVTALYELVPAGLAADAAQPKVDPPKYQTQPKPTAAADSDELMTLKLRYKQPDGDTSTEVVTAIKNECVDFDKASDDVRFAAAVASFGMQLRRSQYAGTWTLSEVQEVAKIATGEDDYALRAEFVEMVLKASELMGEE